MTDDLKTLKKLLDDSHQWPSSYTFKFIGPVNTEQQLAALFAEHSTSRRESRTGKYVSLTVQANLNSSDEVLSLYAAARAIKGVIAL